MNIDRKSALAAQELPGMNSGISSNYVVALVRLIDPSAIRASVTHMRTANKGSLEEEGAEDFEIDVVAGVYVTDSEVIALDYRGANSPTRREKETPEITARIMRRDHLERITVVQIDTRKQMTYEGLGWEADPTYALVLSGETVNLPAIPESDAVVDLLRT